jgi:hypothetical protein
LHIRGVQDLTLEGSPQSVNSIGVRMNAAMIPIPCMSGRLALTGHLPRPREFELDELIRLPRHELGQTQVNCFTGRPVVSAQSYAGARLVDVLDGSGFSSQPRSRLKRCVVIARGLDGYQAIFSWSELYNAAIGESVLVIYERDGRPLTDQIGPLSLLSAGDRQRGPRHLRHLRAVHVQLL